MTSPNFPCLMVRIFFGSFSIAIIGLALAVSCEAKHFKTLSQSSLSPKSYHDHDNLNTPIFHSKNKYNGLFLSRYTLSMQGSINAVSRSSEDFSENGTLSREINTIDRNLQSAISSCRGLLSLASYNLNTLSLPTRGVSTRETLADSTANLCTSLSYIETCLDGFEHAPEKARKIVIASLDSSRKNIRNSLSILSTVDDEHGHNLVSINGGSGSENAWPPSWMSSEERKLLDAETNADVVVAKDGSGKFKTISEAINAAPQNSGKRFVIYVKQGMYYENVRIDESRWNIMMFGDGMDKTIVSAHRSNSTGSSIVDGATFAIHGRGFIARDMGFENTAGPSSSQAVALLSTSDQSVFYKCTIRGYQDAHFAYTGRQFYRECHIYGTIDFIFGYSSTVFQNCDILVRRPLQGQSNMVTAQKKPDPSCPGGFSFQNCNVKAAEDLAGAKTFLGRPWRKYSTVVFMESFLDGLINPLGWSGWGSVGSAPYDTVYYGEYGNKGPGSATSGRVKSKGVRSISAAEAKKFTVREFIGGDQWLPATGVPFQPDLG